MKISPEIFHAHLKCPTKCWLRAIGEVSSGNPYAEWVKSQDESYRANELARLVEGRSNGEVAVSPEAENLKSAQWQLATNVRIQAQVNSCSIESNLHAVERIPSAGRGQAAQFIPVRFIYRNKLTRDDKLLLAFDAFVLSQALGREVSLGKIVHGDAHATLKVKLGARATESARTSAASKCLLGEVRKRLEKIAALLASPTAPRSADSHVRESGTDVDETRGLGGSRLTCRCVSSFVAAEVTRLKLLRPELIRTSIPRLLRTK